MRLAWKASKLKRMLKQSSIKELDTQIWREKHHYKPKSSQTRRYRQKKARKYHIRIKRCPPVWRQSSKLSSWFRMWYYWETCCRLVNVQNDLPHRTKSPTRRGNNPAHKSNEKWKGGVEGWQEVEGGWWVVWGCVALWYHPSNQLDTKKYLRI